MHALDPIDPFEVLASRSDDHQVETWIDGWSDEAAFVLARELRTCPDGVSSRTSVGYPGQRDDELMERGLRIRPDVLRRARSRLAERGEQTDPYPLASRLVAEVISVRELRRGVVHLRLRLIEGVFVPRQHFASHDGCEGELIVETFVPRAERVEGVIAARARLRAGSVRAGTRLCG